MIPLQVGVAVDPHIDAVYNLNKVPGKTVAQCRGDHAGLRAGRFSETLQTTFQHFYLVMQQLIAPLLFGQIGLEALIFIVAAAQLPLMIGFFGGSLLQNLL